MKDGAAQTRDSGKGKLLTGAIHDQWCSLKVRAAYSPSGADLLGCSDDLSNHVIATRLVDVADVNLELRITRDAVHGSWEDLDEASGGNSVVDASAQGRFLHSQSKLGRRKTGVLPKGHEQSAGVAAVSKKLHSDGSRGSNSSDQAQLEAVAFEEGALLNVQLNKVGHAALRHEGALQHRGNAAASIASAIGGLEEVCAVDVEDLGDCVLTEDASHSAASNAAKPKASGLLRGEHHHFQGLLGLEPHSLKGCQGLDATQDPEHSVIHPRERDGIAVGASEDGACACI
mmetsp:Transcript_30762/g.86971  ORF Transcript_30762/g.86971 Transcript_30762/m.86971 type:complete len:287 (+) Transcript_30762:81-941(+)